MMTIFYEHALDSVERGLGLFIFALFPVLFLTAGMLALYWYISSIFARWNEWGRTSPQTARWFWFLSLSMTTFVIVDPFNVIFRRMSNFSFISEAPVFGISDLNLGVAALYFVFILLVIALFYEQAARNVSVFLGHCARWHTQLVSILLGMKITAVHFARPYVTEQYPEEKPELSPIFRGRHMLAWDEKGEHLCIACKACEKICPDRLILIESVRNPETRKQVLTGFVLDNTRCSFCGLCEDVCPTGAVRHSAEFAYSAYTRDDLVLDVFGEYLERTAAMRNKGEK